MQVNTRSELRRTSSRYRHPLVIPVARNNPGRRALMLFAERLVEHTIRPGKIKGLDEIAGLSRPEFAVHCCIFPFD